MNEIAHLAGRILEIWAAMILLSLPAAMWISRRLARLRHHQPARTMGADGRWPKPAPSPETLRPYRERLH